MNKQQYAFVIIGAAGFIGSACSKFLKHLGYKVFEVFRGELGAPGEGVINKILSAETQSFVVIDFAYTSIPNSSFNDPVKDYTENLYNVIRHLEFVKQLPRSRYVYISSGGTVYGNTQSHLPLNEEMPNNPLAPYGITKLACEKYVLMYKEVHGLHVNIVRPANIYGPGQRPFRGQGLVSTAAAKILTGSPIQVFGDGSLVRDYLFIDDFCRVLLDIIRFGENGGIYNAGSGNGCSIREILERISALLGIPATIEKLPSRPFDVQFNVLDSSRVQTLNGWQPAITLNEGLTATINWLQEQSLS